MFESITFLRIIKNGFVNFWRNIWLSAAATLVMTVTLVILSVLVVLYGVSDYTVKTVKERVDISVYFKNGVDENSINKIKQQLTGDPLIKEVRYVSADEALKQFKENHANEPLIQASLEELTENPLPATLQVKAHKIEDYPQVAETLKAEKYKDYIESVNFEDNRKVIERLSKTLDLISFIGGGLAILFSVIAVLVIFNTIALTIYNRREEIEIMRLVGGTNWYIRGPFLVEAMLTSLISTFLAAILFMIAFKTIVPSMLLYTGFINPAVYEVFSVSVFKFIAIIDNWRLLVLNFWILLGLQLVISIFLTFVSSLLAMRRHLKI